MKFQAHKHAANYWTNAIFAASLSFGFYELSIGGPTWLTTSGFAAAIAYFAVFTKWNYDNLMLKNYLNSENFRAKLRSAIIQAVEGNYSYQNTVSHLKSQEFYGALQIGARFNHQTNEKVLNISPIDVELFIGTVKDFKVSVYFEMLDEDESLDHIAVSWESELLDTTLDPLIEE